MYKVPYYQVYQVCYQVVKRKRCYGCGEEYVEKRDMGSNIINPIILRLFGRISSAEKGEMHGTIGEENQDFNKMGKNIKLQVT